MNSIYSKFKSSEKIIGTIEKFLNKFKLKKNIILVNEPKLQKFQYLKVKTIIIK